MTAPDLRPLPTDDDVWWTLWRHGSPAYTATVASRLNWGGRFAPVDTTWTFRALRRLAAAGRVARAAVDGLAVSGPAVWEAIDPSAGEAVRA